jgi:hypothetical protein
MRKQPTFSPLLGVLGQRVLLVEDYPINQQILQDTLSNWGLPTTVADSETGPWTRFPPGRSRS